MDSHDIGFNENIQNNMPAIKPDKAFLIKLGLSETVSAIIGNKTMRQIKSYR